MSSILLSERSLPAEVCQALKVLDQHLVHINRVEVIGEDGRQYTNMHVTNLQIGIQDDMSTLKLFIEE